MIVRASDGAYLGDWSVIHDSKAEIRGVSALFSKEGFSHWEAQESWDVQDACTSGEARTRSPVFQTCCLSRPFNAIVIPPKASQPCNLDILVQTKHVSTALGTIMPVRTSLRWRTHWGGTGACRRRASGHIPVDVRELDCDFYAFSGHKLRYSDIRESAFCTDVRNCLRRCRRTREAAT